MRTQIIRDGGPGLEYVEALLQLRGDTFAHRRKVSVVSTTTIRGLSRIEREFEASDQRRYFVPCPHCGHKQYLQFERLRWAKGRPETAAYHCAGCERRVGMICVPQRRT